MKNTEAKVDPAREASAVREADFPAPAVAPTLPARPLGGVRPPLAYGVADLRQAAPSAKLRRVSARLRSAKV